MGITKYLDADVTLHLPRIHRLPPTWGVAMGRLDQKVALVTSSRLGSCVTIAQQLACEGAKVVVCGRNAAQGLSTVRQIRAEGGRATFILTDIASPSDVQAAIDEAIATYGRLDILFNHASSEQHSRDGSLVDISEAVWDRVVETTLKGAFFCCQYALPFLQQSSSGTIIHLVEGPAHDQIRSVASICQGGVLAMTSVIAQQLPPSAVTANLIWTGPPPASPEASMPVSNLPASDLPASDLPTAISLSANQILYGPLSGEQPFADIAEAVMYLALQADTLHGSALIVRNSP